MVATDQFVFSADGAPLPFDIKDKTLKELKEMGFKDVINFSATSDPISGGMKPILSEHEKHRL